MNLQRLFKLQAELDQFVIEKKGIQGRDLLPERILALQVELGECANEWRGFKFWSNNQSPRTRKTVNCHACKGLGEFHAQVFSGTHHVDDLSEPCSYCNGTGLQEDINPLLVEYVDCLHFVLSIGNSLMEKYQFDINYEMTFDVIHSTSVQQFLTVFARIHELDGMNFVGVYEGHKFRNAYYVLVLDFFGLGKSLGFTWEEIEQAYLDKNKINHERQVTGY